MVIAAQILCSAAVATRRVNPMDCWRVTPEHGFLMAESPLTDPAAEAQAERAALSAVAATAAALPTLVAEGWVRAAARALPIPDIAAAGLSDRAAERVHQAYGFLANAYMWTPEGPPTATLPREIAVPYVAISERLGRPPTLSYADTQLLNWRRTDPAAGFAPENIAPVQVFRDDADEAWFWVIHIAIEAAGAPGVMAGRDACAAAQAGDAPALEAALGEVLAAFEAITALAERISEGCSPDAFYHTLRPFMFVPPEGVIYEGVAAWGGRPQVFLGQTGAQSSLLPALCAALGIRHGETELTAYLDAVRAYMPPAHRAFIAALDGAAVRAAAARSPALRDAYNACVAAAAEFRRVHLTLAATYVAAKVENPKGTGGTDFMRWLRRMTAETREQMLPAAG
jgi:indoleamine 2,3-dioxygenase